MQSVICKSFDYDITIAFLLRYELRRTCKYKYRYECSLVKNLLTYLGTGKENRETNKNILAL